MSPRSFIKPKSNLIVPFFILFATSVLFAADTIKCGNYRIALSFDGNTNDQDDILALPMALGIINQANVKDKLVFLEFSNYIWGNNEFQAKEMKLSADSAAARLGFNRSIMFEVRIPSILQQAKLAFKEAAIKAYNEGARIYYACGGPMGVPYEMVKDLEEKYRKNITVISHHPWNDEAGEGGTWNDLITAVGESIRIQNQGAAVIWERSIADWQWFGNKGGNYEWIFKRNIKAQTATGRDASQYDASDAGMTYYIVTGNDGATMDDAKRLFNTTHTCNSNPTSIPQPSLTTPFLIEQVTSKGFQISSTLKQDVEYTVLDLEGKTLIPRQKITGSIGEQIHLFPQPIQANLVTLILWPQNGKTTQKLVYIPK